MEKTTTIFDNWFDNTSRLVNEWRNMTDRLTGEQRNIWEEAGKMQQNWMSAFQNMMQNMQPASGTNGHSFNPFSHQTTQDAFSNMLKSTDIYTRLLQLWQPVLNAMQNNSFNQQDFWKLIDPQGFKKFVDNLFGFDAVGPMKNFMDQSTHIMNMWMNSSAEAGKNFGPMFQNGMPFFNAMTQMNPQTMTNWYLEMVRSAQRSFAPFMGNPGNGITPSFQPMLEMMEKWGNYMAKLNQMQALLYKTSVSAWEKVMQSIADRTQENNAITDFNQFYNEWSAINEKEFVALFNTDEYAALQAELLKLNSEFNRSYEKQMEAFMQPFPVVYRSQLDEMYKVNHELRGRLNSLERLVMELQNTINKNSPAANTNTGEANTNTDEVKTNTEQIKPNTGKAGK